MAEYVNIADGVEGFAYVDPETNELVTLDSDQPGTNQVGLRPATKQEIDGARRGYAAQGFGQKAAGLGEAVVAGATLGLLPGTGTAESKARSQVLARENPVLKGAAVAAGSFVPALAVEVATGGAATPLLGAGAARILGMGAAELTQSAAMEMADAAQTDRDVEIGNIAQGLFESALFLGAGKFVGKAFRRGEQAVEDLSKVDGSPGQAVARAQQQASSAADVEKIKPTRAEVMNYAANADEIHAEIDDLSYQSGNKLFGADGSASRAHSIQYKKQDILGKMKDADTLAVADNVEAFADQLDALGAKLNDGSATSAPSPAAMRSLKAQAAHLRSTLTGDVEDAAIAYDGAKRHLDDLRSKFGSAATKGNDPLRANVQLIDEVLEPARKNLEDAKVWGKDWARKQADENKLWSGKDGIINSRSIWQSELMERLPGAAGKYRTEFGDLPASVMKDGLTERLLKLGRNERKRVITALENDIAKTEEMSKIKLAIGGPNTRAAVSEVMKDLDDFREAVNEAKRVVRVNDVGGALIKRQRGRASVVEDVLEAAPIGGAVAGGLPGAAAGLAARAVKRAVGDALTPLRAESKALGIDELRANIASRNGARASGRFVANRADLTEALKAGGARVLSAGKETALEAAGGTALASGVLGLAAMSAETAAIKELDQHSKATTERAMLQLGSSEPAELRLPPVAERFRGSYGDLSEAYAARMGELRRIVDDPEEFISRTTAAFGPLAQAGHPEVASKLITRLQVGARYLLENAPPTLGQSMFNPEGNTPDEIAVLQFAPMWEAVFRPLDTVRDFATRDATPSAVRALREVHPDVYQQLMAEAFRTLAAAGPNVDFETKQYLDVTLGLGAALGASFSPQTSNLLARGRQDNKPTGSHLAGESNTAPQSAVAGFSKGPTSIH